ncbi:hypothetical protein [Marinospirillum perlucidum]|uniref:hypothetical protein n=1 Tax=Marinospirillum perlucidum TaxID=1982602 RepID=UPI000DF2F12C|nr:hypothetical protein [Marinospirillum perlucidum]
MSLLPLDFPELSRDQLSCCELRLEALKTWLDQLPLAHPQASYQSLSTFLDEFNRLKMSAPRRLEWLTSLAPWVDKVCQQLEITHQNQAAEAAQALQILLGQGYKRSVNDLLQSREQLPSSILGPSLLEALYQALQQTSELILRACRLGTSTPDKTWKELYFLYRLACQSRLQERPVRDKAPRNCEQAYFRALLLGLIQAEGLRSDELAQLYPLLAIWAPLLKITAATSPEAQFQVLASQHYRPRPAWSDAQINSDQDFGLNAQPISDLLNRQIQSQSAALGNRLLQHLQTLFNTGSDRNAPRLEASGNISLVLGMRSVHFHLSGRKPFEEWTAGGNKTRKQEDNPPSDDPWSVAPDAAENESYGYLKVVELETSNLSTSVEDEFNKRYPVYTLELVNTSATGYCLYWPGKAPAQLATGEMIALQDKAGSPWQPAVIRWVRQADEGHQLGVELLPSRMQPCAIKPLIKVGEPLSYLPGFLIPELRILGTPASVITPLLPFREGQKVEIYSSQTTQRARLVQLLSTPGEFNQFQLQKLGGELGLHTT